MEVKIVKNNIPEAKKASEEAADIILEAIGILAQEYAADGAPVDTGRLKGSMTHQMGDKCVYVGTNVEYAPYVEWIDRYHHNTGHAHFLRDAVTQHDEEYRRLAEYYMKNF